MVAHSRARVDIAQEAMVRVRASHEILIEAAEACQKIYGLTTGVGANKDQDEFRCEDLLDNGELSEETINNSAQFNRELLHAHGAGVDAGVGQSLPHDLVRSILLIRLNAILYGGTGAQAEVAEMLQNFLNHDIAPVIPMRGSLGQADITLLSHMGLAMIGEWYVEYRGKRMPAGLALEAAGLKPLDPWGKDALSIFSSNAYSAALAVHAYAKLRHLADIGRMVYALSLEALNGNVTPILAEVTAARPFPYVGQVAADLRAILRGSYLLLFSDQRALQDPLSYRTGPYRLAALERGLAELGALLAIQLNSSDDNPVVVFGKLSEMAQGLKEIKPVTVAGQDGAVIPSANFTPLPWVIAMERVGLALAHVSAASAQRTLKLSDGHVTGLQRFLGTEETTHAFGAIQKPFVALHAETRLLANPASLDFFAVAEYIEDVATNGPRVMRRVRRMIDNTYYILGFELLHAAQAVDLRMQASESSKQAMGISPRISPLTADFHRQYRQRVPFLAKDDQILTELITASYAFVSDCQLFRGDRRDWAAKGVSCL